MFQVYQVQLSSWWIAPSFETLCFKFEILEVRRLKKSVSGIKSEFLFKKLVTYDLTGLIGLVVNFFLLEIY
jgi:hypothetical protein